MVQFIVTEQSRQREPKTASYCECFLLIFRSYITQASNPRNAAASSGLGLPSSVSTVKAVPHRLTSSKCSLLETLLSDSASCLVDR